LWKRTKRRALEEREIDVNVERFGFEAGEALGHRGEGLADRR